MSRMLHAWINEQRVGTLYEANGLWAFEYSPQWLANPDRYPLCPGIPWLGIVRKLDDQRFIKSGIPPDICLRYSLSHGFKDEGMQYLQCS